MPKSNRARQLPTRELRFTDKQLKDFFTEGDFVDAMFAVRWRLIRAFAKARSAPGRRATPGYIAGLNQQLSSLATYLHRQIGPRAFEKIFSTAKVLDEYGAYSKRERDMIAHGVLTELIMRQLILMRDMHQLWYINGEWWMPQSLQDEYLLLFKGAKESFHNQASFHGRPNRDRARLRRLRLAPGISTAAS